MATDCIAQVVDRFVVAKFDAEHASSQWRAGRPKAMGAPVVLGLVLGYADCNDAARAPNNTLTVAGHYVGAGGTVALRALLGATALSAARPPRAGALRPGGQGSHQEATMVDRPEDAWIGRGRSALGPVLERFFSQFAERPPFLLFIAWYTGELDSLAKHAPDEAASLEAAWRDFLREEEAIEASTQEARLKEVLAETRESLQEPFADDLLEAYDTYPKPAYDAMAKVLVGDGLRELDAEALACLFNEVHREAHLRGLLDDAGQLRFAPPLATWLLSCSS